jgi:hypothetical protein
MPRSGRPCRTRSCSNFLRAISMTAVIDRRHYITASPRRQSGFGFRGRRASDYPDGYPSPATPCDGPTRPRKDKWRHMDRK